MHSQTLPKLFSLGITFPAVIYVWRQLDNAYPSSNMGQYKIAKSYFNLLPEPVYFFLAKSTF